MFDKNRLTAIAVVATLMTGTAFAQSTAGTISGSVLDQTQATIAKASVTVKSLDTGLVRSATTASDGRFSFPGLLVGQYELTVAADGFSKYSRGPLNLVLNQEAVVDAELKPASLQQTVNVTDDAPVLNTSNSEIGVRFDHKRLEELPLSGQFTSGGGFRDIFSVVLSSPGVSQTNSGNSKFADGTAYSTNGIRTRGNNFMVDGQDINETTNTGRSQWMNNPDMIQEIRLITSQFLPEYGRASGSVVNAITKGGSNQLHGSAFWFYNGNAFNSLSNLEKATGKTSVPFYIEQQFGATAGGKIKKDKTFFFGSIQRWTIRGIGTGVTIRGVPTEAGKTTLQQLAGGRPQVAALLKHLPAAQTSIGTNLSVNIAGQSVLIPQGSLTNSTAIFNNNTQWSGRIDHLLSARHMLGGRYLFTDQYAGGSGQITPPGLTTKTPIHNNAASAWLTSTLSSRMVNELRVSYQRYSVNITAVDAESQTIPSVEIPELGLVGFNAAPNRTAIGLAANYPNYRTSNTYQIQDSLSFIAGSHTYKAGFDLRQSRVTSFFLSQVRGRLQYDTLQRLIDDVATISNINKPLPGGELVGHFNWDDYYFFFQDSWRVRKTFTVSYGLRYELPGNSLASLYPVNDAILARNNNQQVFALTNRPGRDTNNLQPRLGFSWNPGGIGRSTVLRGGFARTNDYAFLNINVNVFASFPFMLATNASNVTNAWTALPMQLQNLSSPASLNLQNRTIVSKDFRSPVADQYSMELQHELRPATIVKAGYVGTRGTALFQTLDGNPRLQCAAIPTNAGGVPTGCPRVDPTAGVIRTRANAASSTYHSLQTGLDQRFSKGFSGGAHYTWSSFIDDASDVFVPSTSDGGIAQDSFNRRADRARSSYDRPHRVTTNFVYQLPSKFLMKGWQVSSFMTFQSGSPFSVLNGSDPTLALGGIDALAPSAIRPNLNTTLDLSSMSVEEIVRAGGRTLFQALPACQAIAGTGTCNPIARFGAVGRNILRSDGIAQVDLSIQKSATFGEKNTIQFRADFYNLSNTRNFGIPPSGINNPGFGNQWATDGGNRRIFVSLKFKF